MKTKMKILFMLATVMTMTITGCGTSKEVPALSESVETETVMEDTPTDEVTDTIQEETTETEKQISQSSEVIEESTLTEEKVQLEEEEQNEETGGLEEVKETTENDPDAADPSLTPEELEMIENMFSGEGSFGGEEIQYGGRVDDPNAAGGLTYLGDNTDLGW